MKHAVSIAAFAAFALALGACGRHGGAPSPAGSASARPRAAEEASARAAAVAPSATGSSEGTGTGPTLLPMAIGCRAIAVHGNVTTADGKPLALNASLTTAGVLTLSPGASVAVKHTETARELVISGPGRVLPCERGEERFLLTEGRAQTATWAGARPGAEVLIATPLGAIHYGDAKLEVRVDAHRLTVLSDVGDAWVLPSLAASEEKVPAGKRFEKRGPLPDVKALVVECEKRAEDAEARARAVLVPGRGAASLGVRAAEHVRARKAARAACAIAAASVLSLEDAPDAANAPHGPDAKQPNKAHNATEKTELGRRVAYADARWRSVPPRVDPAQKVESR